ncbi:acetyl-CoA C-acyltransferase family protein [Acidocella aromatica]|uniref:Acetyl-CoA C-acetyltransferase n=1 Tax=Acidocella aromatica TaxID=1303579 RepID=A0A840VCJ0_9PROT|nr:acetyl-CoA C-acyltransferase family protein [Acidocella aromatica]MBB5373608.1 acetyl-CoA C-acetyltransferase [Acidocella aromatica]
MTDVFILSGQRTAIGDYGKALKDVPPTKLGEIAIRAALTKSGVEAKDIQQVVLGNVIHTEPKDAYVSRVAAVNAGIPVEAPALTVNRLCGSGLQAVVSAAQSIMLGDASLAVAGGAESMSRGGYLIPSERWGARLGDSKVIDMVVGALNDPFGHGHMGITAENVAARYGITRAQQDAFSAESHRRAAAAIAAGHFKEQITPVELPSRKGTVIFDTDEHVRAETTAETLAGLKPAFQKDGTVTAGNASGLNDAGAALVLASGAEVASRGLKPLARIVAYGHAGVSPEVMGLGPIPASQNALRKAGLNIADIDVIESNEAFAAQACAVAKDLGLDPAKVNPNGGAVALGHPIGASGAIIAIKAIYELHRTGGRYALATMCIGGGQGIAVIFERV